MRRCAIRPIASSAGTSGATPRPPRDDRGVGQQQRDDDALAVLGERPVEPQHDDLAGAGVAADADLGVEPGRAALVAARRATMTRHGCSRLASFAASDRLLGLVRRR